MAADFKKYNKFALKFMPTEDNEEVKDVQAEHT